MTKILYSHSRFVRKRKKRVLLANQKLFSFGLPSFIVLGGLCYFLFLSSYFGINNIKISGNRTISEGDLRTKVENIISQKTLFLAMAGNIFLLPQDKIEKKILADFPKVEQVSIKRDIPKNIEVILKEREAAAIWCNATQEASDCFFMDASGVVFERAPATEGSLIFKIRERLQRTNISEGSQIFDKDFANKIFEAKKKLENGFSSLSFLEGTVLDGNIVEMKSSEGWKVVFDITSDIESQIQATKKILSEISLEEKSKIEYFDLRVEGRVYYK